MNAVLSAAGLPGDDGDCTETFHRTQVVRQRLYRNGELRLWTTCTRCYKPLTRRFRGTEAERHRDAWHLTELTAEELEALNASKARKATQGRTGRKGRSRFYRDRTQQIFEGADPLGEEADH